MEKQMTSGNELTETHWPTQAYADDQPIVIAGSLGSIERKWKEVWRECKARENDSNLWYRAKRWLIACNREDLLEKLNNIHKSHRLCGDHFEAKMFTNHLRNRLNFNAVPTLFSILVENSSKAEDHSYARPPLIYPESVPEKKYVPTTVDDTKIANSHLLSPPTSIQTCFTVSDTETTSPSVDVVRTASTQTSTTLSFNSPRKRKYGDLIKNLIKENQSLRQNAENFTVTCKLIKIELP